jgi:transposase InsO family protein
MPVAHQQESEELTPYPTAEWLARQITEACPWARHWHLIRDNDCAFGQIFTACARAMGIRGRPISAGSPWQNGVVERLIGTLRRECLHRVVIFDEAHRRRILAGYAAYYNQPRTHLALQKDAPLGRTIQRVGAVIAIPWLAHCTMALCHH